LDVPLQYNKEKFDRYYYHRRGTVLNRSDAKRGLQRMVYVMTV